MNQKRHIELSVFTRGGYQSSVLRPLEIVKHAYRNGSTAVAVTDFDSVWSYYDFASALKHIDDIAEGPKHDFKVIYGIRLSNVIQGGDHYSVTLLVKNKKGLQNLYRIISEGLYHDKTWVFDGPVVWMDSLWKHNDGLLMGRDIDRDFIQKAKGISDEELECELEDYFTFFDYAELRAENFLLEGSKTEYDAELAERIARILQSIKKCPVAVNDIAAITPEDEICWKILNRTKEKAGFLQSTEEVMDKFSFFGDMTETVVIENTNIIADQIDAIDLFESPVGEFSQDVERELRERCYQEAERLYGEELPNDARERLEKEFKLIGATDSWGNFAYVTDIVDKCKQEGWRTMFRGCAANSLVSHLLGWTATDPLPRKDYNNRQGKNLPYEFFLGTEANPKKPDIELAVSPGVRDKVVDYLRNKAGGQLYTFGYPEVENRHAFNGSVDAFIKWNGLSIEEDMQQVIKEKLNSVNKRSISRHPGAILILPHHRDITEYAPAIMDDDGVSVTVLPKQLIPLAHINLLPDSRLSVSMNDIKRELNDMSPAYGDIEDMFRDDMVKQYYREEDAYSIFHEDKDAAQIIDELKPKNMTDLLNAFGLIHGTGTWKHDVVEVLNSGFAWTDAIFYREDVMRYLMDYGLEREDAFRIAEYVRRGHASYVGFTEEQKKLFKEHNVSEWLIESMEKIQYLFPKGHALECIRVELLNLCYAKRTARIL